MHCRWNHCISPFNSSLILLLHFWQWDVDIFLQNEHIKKIHVFWTKENLTFVIQFTTIVVNYILTEQVNTMMWTLQKWRKLKQMVSFNCRQFFLKITFHNNLTYRFGQWVPNTECCNILHCGDWEYVSREAQQSVQKQHSMLPSLTTENRLLLLTVSERWAPEGQKE